MFNLVWSLPRKIGALVGAGGAWLTFGIAIERISHIENFLTGFIEILSLTLLVFMFCALFLFSIPLPRNDEGRTKP